MKKLLLSTIFILIIILAGITVVKGMEIGKLKILGITEIRTENDQLDETLKDATKLASTDYQKNINDLNGEVKKLEAEKTRYEEMVSISTESEIQAANQSYNYTLDMLYTRIGNHAKSEGITNLTIALQKSSSGVQNVYDINFTAVATYVEIEEFITDIEDDSKLGFKIENFKMSPSSQTGSLVQATFTCRNITVTGISEGTSGNMQMNTNENTDTNLNTNTNSTRQTNTVE